MNVYRTHSPEEANKLRGIDDVTFNRMVSIIWQLREETKDNGQGKGDMVYALSSGDDHNPESTASVRKTGYQRYVQNHE